MLIIEILWANLIKLEKVYMRKMKHLRGNINLLGAKTIRTNTKFTSPLKVYCFINPS